MSGSAASATVTATRSLSSRSNATIRRPDVLGTPTYKWVDDRGDCLGSQYGEGQMVAASRSLLRKPAFMVATVRVVHGLSRSPATALESQPQGRDVRTIVAVEQRGERHEGSEVRRLGETLSGVGTPWALTLLGLCGLRVDTSLFAPLLWFAPPFLFMRLLAAARRAPARARSAWLGSLAVGTSAWVLAVAASLLGARAVMQAAHWVGVAVGTVLFCAGMLALSRALGWADYTERWRSAQIAAVVGSITSVVAAGAVMTADALGAARAVALRGWGVMFAVWSFVVWVVALVRVARMLRRTRARLLSCPDTTASTDLFVSTHPAS